MVEAARAEHALQLVTQLRFQLFEALAVQAATAGAGLVAGVHAAVGAGGHVDHVQADRLRRVFRVVVAAHAYRVVEFDPAVGLGRRIDFVHAELLERLPVADHDLGVHQRELHVLAQGVGLLRRQVAQQVRNDHVVAGHDAVLAAHLAELAAAAVADVHAAADVAHAHRCTVEADAHRGFGLIELGVVERGEDDIVHGVPRCHGRDQAAHQQARQRGVAVGEVVDVGLFHFRPGFFADRLQIHRAEAWETD
ncbi:hypothetical protein D3C76_758800 [compost metagenome]